MPDESDENQVKSKYWTYIINLYFSYKIYFNFVIFRQRAIAIVQKIKSENWKYIVKDID